MYSEIPPDLFGQCLPHPLSLYNAPPEAPGGELISCQTVTRVLSALTSTLFYCDLFNQGDQLALVSMGSKVLMINENPPHHHHHQSPCGVLCLPELSLSPV